MNNTGEATLLVIDEVARRIACDALHFIAQIGHGPEVVGLASVNCARQIANHAAKSRLTLLECAGSLNQVSNVVRHAEEAGQCTISVGNLRDGQVDQAMGAVLAHIGPGPDFGFSHTGFVQEYFHSPYFSPPGLADLLAAALNFAG